MKKKIVLLLSFLFLFTIILAFKYESSNNNCSKFAIDMNTRKIDNKTVLLIHGYPEPIYPDTPVYKYFEERNYNIIAPYLFTPEFKLNKNEIKKHIEVEIGEKNKPDVILGISMGGLIAPQIAEDYPESKLVLIATGPNLKTDIKVLNDIVENGNEGILRGAFRFIRLIPNSIYSIVYKTFNHLGFNKRNPAIEKHIQRNWECVKSISVDEDIEAVQFLAEVDNTKLLKGLRNETLIFAGDSDVMMPSHLSTDLNELIQNSKLIVGKGKIHFSVFGEENYKDLDDFLGE